MLNWQDLRPGCLGQLCWLGDRDDVLTLLRELNEKFLHSDSSVLKEQGLILYNDAGGVVWLTEEGRRVYLEYQDYKLQQDILAIDHEE